MEFEFAALRFIEDENISDRVYWYLSSFLLKEGELVLAPVGNHNRLQAARVERVLTASEENAPYDLNLIKNVAVRLGARRLKLPSFRLCADLGGVRYDAKRFTRYGSFLRSAFPDSVSEQEFAVLKRYGVETLLNLRSDGEHTPAAAIPIFSCSIKEGGEYAEILESEDGLLSLKILAEATGCVLFGCENGIEKTGVISATLYLLAGVAEEKIKEDFFLFDGDKRREREEKLDVFFRAVSSRGGIEAYLSDIGMRREEINLLKGKLQ